MQYTELKRLAEGVKNIPWDGLSATEKLHKMHNYWGAASPDVVLGMIAQNAALLEALNTYMSAFGQFVESIQVEFSQQQKDADLQARTAIKLAEWKDV